jgi:hypothetical protein
VPVNALAESLGHLDGLLIGPPTPWNHGIWRRFDGIKHRLEDLG